MARKIGWKMKLRRKLRQDRAEQKIRARQGVKQAKQLQRIYKDMTPEEADEMNAIAPQVGLAEQQLADDGYNPTGEPLETMAMYNEVYGDGNGDLQETVEQCFGEVENWDSESIDDAYLDLGRGAMDLVQSFRDNIKGEEAFETENIEEHLFEKLKARFGKFKKDIGVDKPKTDSEKTVSTGTGSQMTSILIGALFGWALAKILG